ncbi:UNVERIFIED_CONTAM: hypothetical protein FKN15_023436 [Acipenser sinensis]
MEYEGESYMTPRDFLYSIMLENEDHTIGLMWTPVQDSCTGSVDAERMAPSSRNIGSFRVFWQSTI